MPTTILTPYMSMALPVPLVETSPYQGAVDLNSALSIADAHDHTAGKGLQIQTSAINLNADLSFNNTNATTIRAVKLATQASTLIGLSDTSCIYAVGGNLWWNSGNGAPLQLTLGAALNLSSTGSITGLSGTAAALSFSSSTNIFTFTQASNVNAGIVAGSVSLSSSTASANTITLQSPGSLAAGYSITLPAALPAAVSKLRIDAAGNLTTLSIYGPQISASSGTFNSTNLAFTQVTNLSVTIQTTGRPVVVFLQPDSSGNGSYIGCSSGSNSSARIDVQIKRGTSVVYYSTPILSTSTVTGFINFVAPGTIHMLDTPAAGSSTYTVQFANANPGSSVLAAYCVLVAYEV